MTFWAQKSPHYQVREGEEVIPMLTVFALPKPFRGHIGVIQRNAITSWARLSPRPEIILFGNQEGTAEIARELGLRHVPDVCCNEYGTPLLNDLFQKAQDLATHGALCYVNADILLLSDFMKAVEQVASRRDRFLLAGRRTNLDLDQLLDFDSPQCETQLRRWALEKGTLGVTNAIDYFVFSSGLYVGLPPLALGRGYWDNWLLWKARASHVSLVDASGVVLAIHQNHDYSHQPHHPRTDAELYSGEEAKRNFRLVGVNRVYSLDNATHKLAAKGFEWNAGHLVSPSKRALRRWWVVLVQTTVPLRHRLGIRGPRLQRFSRFVMGILDITS
jgi:hypothetical protein